MERSPPEGVKVAYAPVRRDAPGDERTSARATRTWCRPVHARQFGTHPPGRSHHGSALRPASSSNGERPSRKGKLGIQIPSANQSRAGLGCGAGTRSKIVGARRGQPQERGSSPWGVCAGCGQMLEVPSVLTRTTAIHYLAYATLWFIVVALRYRSILFAPQWILPLAIATCAWWA
jgi:hypothetical protein